MQWTVPQIVRELANLDMQILSYCQRAMMADKGDEDMIVRLHNFQQAYTDLLTSMLAQLHGQLPALHVEIAGEQNDWPHNVRTPADVRVTIFNTTERKPR